MKAEITTITPEQAARMLRGNTKNRPIRYRLVDRYARDMAAGNWKMNGSTVVMNGRTLIDGQHRLAACVQADAPFQTVLITGAQQSAMDSIDTGAKRTVSDVLRINNIDNAPMVASIANLGLRWDTGLLTERRFIMPSTAEVLAWIDANPQVHQAVELVWASRLRPLRAPISAMGVACVKAIQHRMGDEFGEFTDNLISGEGLTAGDPVYALRTWMLRQASGAARRFNADIGLAYIVKAWNADVEGQQIHNIAFKSRGRGREQFPVMVNDAGLPISYQQDDS
jgi:hypothetical protein